MSERPRDDGPVRSLVVSLVRAFLRGEEAVPPPEGVDWRMLERVARRSQLGPILRHTLDPERIPPELRQRWDEASISTLVRYGRALRATVELLGILEEEEIPAAALRGMALAEWVYPSPALRPMLDVDLFVAAEGRERMVRALAARGHQPWRTLRTQVVYRVGETYIEVHWSLLTPKRYRGVARFPEWLSTRERIETAEGDVFRLAAEHQLLEIVLHAFLHHGIDRMTQLVDIALLASLDGLDWDHVARWCAAARVGRIVHFVLSSVDALFELGLRARIRPLDPRGRGPGPEAFEAFEPHFFGGDSLGKYLRRRRVLLRAAERWSTRARQWMRFVNRKELATMLRLLRGPRR